MSDLTSSAQDTLFDPPTVEEGVNALLDDGQQFLKSRYKRCEEKVRENPGKAVLVALAAGCLAHHLPLRSILVAKVKIIAALTPPLLLALGAAKACEFLQTQAREKR